MHSAMREEEKKWIIARRAALELRDGDIVNLGIGIPTMVAGCVPSDINVFFHTENGLLGVGPYPEPGQEDPDLVNAGKQPVTATPGASYFDSASSFAMIRGGHIDIAIMGALQVSQEGDIANWTVPGGNLLGVGGAMDLVVGSRKLVVTMLHTTKDGKSKLVRRCTIPITARREVDTLITEFGVFRIRNGRMWLQEIAPNVTLEELRTLTEAEFDVSADLRPMTGWAMEGQPCATCS